VARHRPDLFDRATDLLFGICSHRPPLLFGHITDGAPVGALAELLAASVNPMVVGFSRSPAEIEGKPALIVELHWLPH